MYIANAILATLSLASIGQDHNLNPNALHVTFGPKLTWLSNGSGNNGTLVTAATKEFSVDSAIAVFRRADGTGTLTNGGFGKITVQRDGTATYKFSVPLNLKEGKYKLSLWSKDMSLKTNEREFWIWWPDMNVEVKFIDFKCLDDTNELGSSDETYFFADYWTNSADVGYTATQVIEETDSGDTYKNPMVIYSGPERNFKDVGIVVGLGDCDNWDWITGWKYDYFQYKGQPVETSTWGLMMACGLYSQTWDDWMYAKGKYAGKPHPVDSVLPYMVNEIAKEMDIVGDDLIGARWLKFSDVERRKFHELRGKGVIKKQVHFTGDGGDYLVNFEIRTSPIKKS